MPEKIKLTERQRNSWQAYHMAVERRIRERRAEREKERANASDTT